MICSIPDCERDVWARGWCSLHLQRWYKHGTTDLILDRSWVNPLVCVCETPDADPARNFGQCEQCKRVPVALMHGRFAS